MKVKRTSTHAHTQATRLVAKSKRLSARPSMLLSAIALVCSGSSAFAACDTATITGNCLNLVLPSVAGNVNYVVGSGATVSNAPNLDSAITINQDIKSLTNDGQVTTQGVSGQRSWGYKNIAIETAAVVSGDITNNGQIIGTPGFDTDGLVIRGTVGGNIVNTGRISTRDWSVAINIRETSKIGGSLINTKTGVIENLIGIQPSANHALEIMGDMKSIVNEGSIYSEGWWGQRSLGLNLELSITLAPFPPTVVFQPFVWPAGIRKRDRDLMFL